MNEIAPITPATYECGDFSMSDNVDQLFAALTQAQASDLSAAFNSTNPAFKSKYANLAAIWDAVRKPFSDAGLCVVQFPSARDKSVSVRTMIGHKSGQWIATTLTAVAKDATPQSVGSAVTYLRRFGLTSLAGVVAEPDDDGNAASGRSEAERGPPAQSGSLREHAQSLPPRQPVPAEGFKLIGPDGQEHTATARDGNSALVVWMSWFRAALKSPKLGTADALRNWFMENGRNMDAIERASADAFSAANQAYTARYAELDDSFPIKREPATAAAK